MGGGDELRPETRVPHHRQRERVGDSRNRTLDADGRPGLARDSRIEVSNNLVSNLAW